MATWSLREAMNASAVMAPHDVDEFEYTGLKRAPSTLVKAPRVAESPVHLECLYTQSLELESDEDDDPNTVVFGKVIGVHIDDQFIKDGLVDTAALEPIGRLGYLDYVKVDKTFSMDRPQWK
jgi:flavin reductase (DIM6/NTAB) family NADH-FMN oxidoreductase RutF